MKIHGYYREWKVPLKMMFKKHFCPFCGAQMGKVKASKVIDAKSEEAHQYDLDVMCGSVKIVWTEFRCPECGRQYTIEEMKKIEEQNGQ